MRFANLKVDIPSDWTDGSLYTFIAPHSGAGGIVPIREFRSNVVFQNRKLEPAESLEQCVERVKAHLVELYGQIAFAIDDGPRVGPGPSRRISYTVSGKGAVEVAQVIYVFTLAGQEWQAAFSAIARNLKESLPQWDTMVASVQLSAND